MIEIQHDRRKWDRIPLAVPFFIHGKDSEGQEFFHLTVASDIGGGGLFFASHRSLPRHANLTLQVPSAPWLKKLLGTRGNRTLKGRIVRVVPTETLNYYALQFTQPLITIRSVTSDVCGVREPCPVRADRPNSP